MKTTFKFAFLLFLAFVTLQSCEDMDDVAAPENLEVQDFVWKGLNLYYLWQADVPNLNDNRFANQAQLNAFLSKYSSPEELFNALRVDKSIDRFSWIVSDYNQLEGMLQGTTKNNGVDYALSYKAAGSEAIFGIVRYILPNSDASNKDIKRGDIFYGVNGTALTAANYQNLLSRPDSYTLNMADYNNGQITPNGKSVSLTKTDLSENPILINTVIETGGHKIGYLMYNGFYSNYDANLNAAFDFLKSKGITDLVLDLRYNSGGSVLSATRLASMISGQPNSKIFSKTIWNSKINAYLQTEDPESLNYKFTTTVGTSPLVSLNLDKVYILTTKSTASASELVINGLIPYMSVVQIGDVTTGKNVGSITIYDSPSFGKANRNPLHRYAMQPIVFKTVNAQDFGDYYNGLTPTFQQKESLQNLGVLGNSSEPLLSTAIAKITGTARTTKIPPSKEFPHFKDSKSLNGLDQMHTEKVPAGLLKAL